MMKILQLYHTNISADIIVLKDGSQSMDFISISCLKTCPLKAAMVSVQITCLPYLVQLLRKCDIKYCAGKCILPMTLILLSNRSKYKDKVFVKLLLIIENSQICLKG